MKDRTHSIKKIIGIIKILEVFLNKINNNNIETIEKDKEGVYVGIKIIYLIT